MRNFIKYSGLRLRDHPGQCIPKGPSFSHARKVQADLLGSQLVFRAPRHAPQSDSSYMTQIGVSRSGEPLDNGRCNSNQIPSESWNSAPIFFRDWAYYGPWFTGYMGHVCCSVEGIYLEQPQEQLNFVHPKALETAVLSYITALYGHNIDEDHAPRYRAPLNWQPVNNLPVPALRFDIDPIFPGSRDHNLFFPVARDKIIGFLFRYNQSTSGHFTERDAKISPQPMLDLIENIIGSIQLTLSPECQQAVDEVKKSCTDFSVSPHCAPLKWPAHVDKSGINIVPFDKKLYPDHVY